MVAKVDGIGEALRFVSRLYAELSLLLRSCDAALAQAGWRPFDSTCRIGLSASVNEPGAWLPDRLFRFYYPTAKQSFETIAVVSCLLLDREKEFGGSLDVPILAASQFWLDGPTDLKRAKDPKKPIYWMSKAFGWCMLHGHKADGSVVVESRGEFDEGWVIGGQPVVAGTSVAWPLETFRTESEISTLVVSALKADAPCPP